MAKNASYEEHIFFCLKCGNKGLPLMRQQGFRHKKFHRKKLYCIHCQQEINHIECKTSQEVEEFQTNFKNGVYKDEAEESISYVWNSGQR